MRRFLVVLTLVLKILSLVVLFLVVVFIVRNTSKDFSDFRSRSNHIERYNNCWLAPNEVDASVLTAVDKLILDKQEQERVKRFQQMENVAVQFLKKNQGAWKCTVVQNVREGETEIGKVYSAKISDQSLRITFSPDSCVTYSLLRDVDSESPRFYLQSGGTSSLYYLENGDAVNELIIYGPYWDEYEDESVDDGPGRGDMPYGVVAKLRRN